MMMMYETMRYRLYSKTKYLIFISSKHWACITCRYIFTSKVKLNEIICESKSSYKNLVVSKLLTLHSWSTGDNGRGATRAISSEFSRLFASFSTKLFSSLEVFDISLTSCNFLLFFSLGIINFVTFFYLYVMDTGDFSCVTLNIWNSETTRWSTYCVKHLKFIINISTITFFNHNWTIISKT